MEPAAAAAAAAATATAAAAFAAALSLPSPKSNHALTIAMTRQGTQKAIRRPSQHLDPRMHNNRVPQAAQVPSPDKQRHQVVQAPSIGAYRSRIHLEPAAAAAAAATASAAAVSAAALSLLTQDPNYAHTRTK